VVTAVILPLISYAGTRLISYLNSKIKNEKAKDLLTQATTVVTNAVRAVFQTYVDSLKKSGNFGTEAQLEALNKAKDIALSQLSEEVKEYITKNYGDINNWLTTQIEATINLIKN
jgi:ribosome-binding factor A